MGEEEKAKAREVASVALVIGRNIIAALIIVAGFGIGIGRVLARVDTAEKTSIAHSDARADALKESIDDFKKEIRGQLEKNGQAATDAKVAVGIMQGQFTQHMNGEAARDLEFAQWRSTIMAIRMVYPQSRLPAPPPAAPKEKEP
jgi:hypothetical protein